MAEFTDEMESKINERFEALEKKNATLEKQVSGAEELLQKHKTEIGDARKEFQAAIEGVSGIDKEKLQKAIDKLDEMEDNLNNDSKNSQGRNDKEENKDIRKRMTKAQRELADEQFKKLEPAERMRIKNDPEEMTEFLNAAMEAAPVVPESLFDDDSDEGAETEVNKYRRLFGIAEEEASHVPGGARVGGGRHVGAKRLGQQEDQPVEKRLPDGVIPRPPAPAQ